METIFHVTLVEYAFQNINGKVLSTRTGNKGDLKKFLKLNKRQRKNFNLTA